VIIPCRGKKWLTGDSGYLLEPPPERGTIGEAAMETILRLPLLTTVRFSSLDTTPVTPAIWRNLRENGVLIRSYTTGDEQFYHIRRLDLEMSLRSGKEQVWTDSTYYEGDPIPEAVLDQVYEIKGRNTRLDGWRKGFTIA
jgi:hypothetical protein